MPTHDHFELGQIRERLANLPTGRLIERVTSGVLSKEAAISIRQIIKERSDNADRATVYVALNDEGTDVWRPVEASWTKGGHQ